MTKQADCITVMRENPNLKDKDVAQIVGCGLRTVSYAKSSLKKKHKKNMQALSQFDLPDVQDRETNVLRSVDPVELLMDTCMMMLSKPNPEARWGTILKDILKNTGRLDVKLQSEEEYKSWLSTLSASDLVRISTGQDSPASSSETDDAEESFYR